MNIFSQRSPATSRNIPSTCRWYSRVFSSSRQLNPFSPTFPQFSTETFSSCSPSSCEPLIQRLDPYLLTHSSSENNSNKTDIYRQVSASISTTTTARYNQRKIVRTRLAMKVRPDTPANFKRVPVLPLYSGADQKRGGGRWGFQANMSGREYKQSGFCSSTAVFDASSRSKPTR